MHGQRAQPDGQRVISVRLTLTAPGCGMGDVLVQDIRQKLEIIPTVSRRTSSWCSTRRGTSR